MRSLSAFSKTAKGLPKFASKGDRDETDDAILGERDNDFYGSSTAKRYSGNSGRFSSNDWDDKPSFRTNKYRDRDGDYGSFNDYKRKPKFSDSRPSQPAKSKNVRKLIKKYNLVDFGGQGRGPMDVEAVETDYHEKLATDEAGFTKYNLPPKLLDRMNELGYTSPFKIQAATLEHTLNGQDVFAKAFTGSGKTLAFAIPIIKKLTEIDEDTSPIQVGHPRCLVLSPTRELCQQIHDTLQKLAPNLKCMATYGGVDMEQQMRQLRGNIDIVCATPGRLRDLFQRQHLKTSDIKIICLDEADALLKPDFMTQIEEILKSVRQKQMLMFSATLSEEVEHLLETYMNKPKMIDLTRNEAMPLPKNINHYLVEVEKRQAGNAIKHLIEKFETEQCIVFVNKIVDTQFYANLLNRMGLRAAAISSDKTQAMRSSIIRSFKSGSTKVLVATDVAARGLDVPAVNLIINIGSSSNGLEAYIHRSGRTGRAGKIGSSVVIDTGSDDNGIEDIKQLIKLKSIEIPEEALRAVPSRAVDRFERPEADSDSSTTRGPRRVSIKRYEDDDQDFETNRFNSKPKFQQSSRRVAQDDDDDFEDYRRDEKFSKKPDYDSRYNQKRPTKWRVD